MPSSLQTCPVSSVFHSVASCCASAHGVTNSASFLSSASYGSSVGGAPSGGGPGFRPRLAQVPRNAGGTLVCAWAGKAGCNNEKTAIRRKGRPRRSAPSAREGGAPAWRCLPDPGTALLRFEGYGLSVGERDAEEEELRLAVASRPPFERQLLAWLRYRAPPSLCFELARRRSFDRPLLHG